VLFADFLKANITSFA